MTTGTADPFRPVARSPLAEQVSERLREQIRTEGWPPGYRLPSESALAQLYGVGRSTIREAIRVLAGEGMLESRQGAGVFVTVAPGRSLADLLRRATLREIYELRRALEVEAATLAAQRADNDDLAVMQEALDRRNSTAAGRGQAYVDADVAFHEAVVAGAHNSLLSALFAASSPVLRDRVPEMLGEPAAGDGKIGDHAHQMLVAAIRAGDPAAAAEAARTHVRSTLEWLRSTLEG